MSSISITSRFGQLKYMVKNYSRKPSATKPCPVDDKPLPSRDACEIERRPQPPQPKPDLFARVISILILDKYISATDAICVALTCKHLHYTGVTFSQLTRQAIKEDGRTSILRRLEPTLPGRFLCLEGPKLVRLHPTPGSSTSGEMVHSCCHRVNRNMRGDSTLVPRDLIDFGYRQHRKLPLCDARMATSYALHGPGHGIHPCSLGTSYAESRSVSRYLLYDESWKVLVTRKDNNLLFRSTRRFRQHNSGTLDSMVHWFQNNSLTVCPHFTITLVIPSHGIEKPKEAKAEWACPFCYSDCEAKMEIEKYALRSRNYKWSITITMWHDVGPCRARGEPKWESFKRDEYQGRTLGSASRAWEADGEPRKRWFFCSTV